MSPRKKRSALRLWSEYMAIRLVAFILKVLPLGAAAALGRGVTGLLYRFDKRHRERCADQIVNAYHGEMSREQALGVTQGIYDHFGTMLAEFIRLPRLTRENIDRHVDWNGWDRRIIDLLAEGKGAVFPTGHIGNWEFSGAAFVLKGLATGAVARPLDNPLLDRFIRALRESSGQEIWEKRGALRKVVRVLKNGKAFGILVDQDAGQNGIFVPFFGIDASTNTTPADLALVTGAPILTLALQRTAPMKFIARGGEVLRPDTSADRNAERERLMRLVNRDLEAIVRHAPEQWLWLHRRWKTRPPTPGGSPASVATAAEVLRPPA